MTRWLLGVSFAAAFAAGAVGGCIYVFGNRAWTPLRDEVERRALKWWAENA